ncbi:MULTISPECIES: DUF3899 domain-containing protein [Staphylococcus]|uniref:DUF3899 domain-containing protein n=1 Tax=Staphylococcus pettenkoferi TaxID=170573 RepID=A0A2N6QKZ7_9STAP|nr:MULTISPECIES: DUF3899 domain-containing protein [Staphylococcus]MBX8993559.1 DUF3899 domain-containing protein [Staphylococcus pettenkoferi]MCI2791202.1 DUF3899 domain-containing protein [Staphylococcus pettenkoferi]MCY1566624.1 DUF3899 domain-containing protein [Staphylococcus pettenkoferi]MCY1587752.1 DUF3899 domain-containing protein [Staphylococcus pettenkoferi]MCY1603369.1 DUF3899 domain-containing protein [Staphylococcus pettenkoferi]
MRNLSQLLTFILLTPIISLIIWLFTSHHWVEYVNIVFYVAMILSIVTFILILIQEGVFDATSYGMRRMKYRLSSKKHQASVQDDDFFNPQQAKKNDYRVARWVKVAFGVNVCYLVLDIIMALMTM